MNSPNEKVDGDLRAPSAPPAPKHAPGGRVPPAPADESPGVPGFRTWRGVYWFVLAFFVAIVAALTVFSRVYA